MSASSTIAPEGRNQPVVRDDPAPGVARLRLDRPAQRNVMDAELREALDSGLRTALADDEVRAVVLAGAPKVFSGGGDISSMSDLDTASALARLQAGHRLVRRLATAEKPLVAAPTGWTVGAAVGLVLLCDCVVAGPSTRIGFPFFRLALVPDWGISASLPRRVGPARARQLLLGGRTVDAEEALATGLVDVLVDDGEVDAAAVERARQLARLPRQALALTKRLLAEPRPLGETLELEAAAQALCLVSADAAEGRSAFFEKRQPKFLT